MSFIAEKQPFIADLNFKFFQVLYLNHRKAASQINTKKESDMNKLTVSKIQKALERSIYRDLVIRFDDGKGTDSHPTFTLKSTDETYIDGYECVITIGQGVSNDCWSVYINAQFNKFDFVDTEEILHYVLGELLKHKRTPCAEERLAIMEQNSNGKTDPYQ